MSRALLCALGLVALAASPSGAGWATSGLKGTTASAKTLTATAAPAATTSCVGDGKVGVSVTWTHAEADRSGYEVWRVVDMAPSKVVDAPASATTTVDIVNVGLQVDYYVVTRSSTWTAPSPLRRVSGPPVCTGPRAGL